MEKEVIQLYLEIEPGPADRALGLEVLGNDDV